MAINHSLLSRARLSEYSVARLVLVAVGGCFALAAGLVLVEIGGAAAVLFPLALGTILLAIWSPYWAVVLVLAQLAFIPCERELLGYYVPNVMQLLAPLVVGAALLQALKNTDHERLAPRTADFLVGGLGLWGLVGMFLAPGGIRWKHYGNKMLFPMLLYYAIRLLPIKRRDLQRLITMLLVAVAVQSLLMVRESIVASSPLYGVQSGLIQGVKPCSGPFNMHWTAGAYLCLWPPLFVYAIASSKHWQGKLASAGGLMAMLGALTRTMQRAPLLGALLGMSVGLVAPRHRRTTAAVIGILALLYIPWSMGRPGSGLLERFQETDQSRYAYRTAAINLLRSPDWNPIWGTGFMAFKESGGEFGTEERVVAWGSHRGTVAQVAAGSALHNVWLALPVEFGIPGTLLAIGVLLCLAQGIWRIRAKALSEKAEVDYGLLFGLLGSLVALGGIGFYQNIYLMEASMAMLWSIYALLVGHPRAFVEPKMEQAVAAAKGTRGTTMLGS